MENSNKKHLTELSLARIFAIYWVVLIQHNFAPYHESWGWVGHGEYYSWVGLGLVTKYITIATMPLCFFISGFILNYRETLEKCEINKYVKTKVLRLLLPCILFGVLFEYLRTGSVTYHTFLGYSHLWFIFDLFIYFILALFVFRFKNPWIQLVVFIGALMLSYVSKILGIGSLENLFSYFLWFQIGFISCYFKDYIFNRVHYVLLSFGLVFAATILFSNDNGVLWSVYPFFAILFLLCTARYICKRFNLEQSKLLKSLDNASYGVYIFHMIWLYVFYQILLQIQPSWLIDYRLILSSVLAVSTIPVSILTTKLLKKVGLKI